MRRLTSLIVAFASGAATGFLYGTHFDWRGWVDWVAVGAVASAAVAIVAVVPIFREHRRRQRQTRATRDHVSALLTQIESLLHLKLISPVLGPISPTEAAPVHELFALIPQLGLLDEPESRHVIVASGKARMLVLVDADPSQSQHGQEFQGAKDEVNRARKVVNTRILPSNREI